MIEIEYSHDKSNLVKKSLKTGEEFTEEEKLPQLIWIPVILLSMLAFEYLSYLIRGDVAVFFKEQDPTFPFLFGLIFSVACAIAVFLIYNLKRKGIYWTVAIMIIEWFYYGGFGLLKIERFDIDGNIMTYPMMGGGIIPGIDLLLPIYVLILRQIFILGALILLWKKFD